MQLRKFEITPDMLEAQEAASRDRTVAGQRHYSRVLADLEAYGRAWRATVRESTAAGLSPEEIAQRTGNTVADVFVALGSLDEEAGP